MSRSVLVQLDLPKDWRQFRMPPALQDRLQELLDLQDQQGKLSRRERREATALTELADILSLLKLRAAQATNLNGKTAAALERFRSGEISFPRAAEPVGLDIESFRLLLHERNIPWEIDAESSEDLDGAIQEFYRSSME